LRRSRHYLKAVADALGAVRDQDVAIMALEKLKEEAPPEVVAGIERLMAARNLQREQARGALVEAVSENVLARLQGEFAYALEQAVKTAPRREGVGGDESAGAHVSFRQSGRDIIAAGFEELQKLSASLYQPFKTEPLHRMRIAAKRLRYAIELFAQCWGESLKPFATEIAEMQSDLGELHDMDEWIVTLGKRLRAGRSSRRRATNDEPNAEALEDQRAAAWLLGYFIKARTKHYRAALARWHEWKDKNFAVNLMASLDAEPEAIELEPLTLTAADAVASDLQSA
jgi:CHAD domain-containing protein